MKWSEVSFLRKQESRLLWHVPVELDSKWGLGHMESADVLDSRFRTSPHTPPSHPARPPALPQPGWLLPPGERRQRDLGPLVCPYHESGSPVFSRIPAYGGMTRWDSSPG